MDGKFPGAAGWEEEPDPEALTQQKTQQEVQVLREEALTAENRHHRMKCSTTRRFNHRETTLIAQPRRDCKTSVL